MKGSHVNKNVIFITTLFNRRAQIMVLLTQSKNTVQLNVDTSVCAAEFESTLAFT